MKEFIDPVPGTVKTRMPGFVVGWMITDLVFVALRTLTLPLLVIWVVSLPGRFLWSAVAELALALLIAGTGLAGDIGLLCKQRWAVSFAGAAAFFSLLTFGADVWSGIAALGVQSSTSQLYLGIVIFCVLQMIRVALLVFYVIAVVRAAEFFRENDL